jgi:anti-anti-sigma factor
MEITVLQEQGRIPVTVLTLQGNLDSSTYAQLEQHAKEAIVAGARDLLIDMTHVSYMSSAGIRVLTTLFNQLHSASEIETARQTVLRTNFKSPHLKLAGVSPRVLLSFA